MKALIISLFTALASLIATNAAVTETTVVSPGDDGCQYYRIPAIVKANNGNLIAVYDWRGNSNSDIKANGSSDRGRVKLMKKISTDNGATWSRQTEMFPGFINERDHGDAALVNDLAQDGHLVCVMATDAYYGTTGGKIYVSHTYDYGENWSTPEEMVISNRPAWQKAFVASGSMLYVTHGGTNTQKRDIMCVVLGKTAFEERLYVLRSSDMGRTWTIAGSTEAGNESKLAELPDGSLLMSIRNSGNHKFARSTDGGATWTQSSSTIKESGVNSAILPVLHGGDQYYFLSIPDAPLSRANLSLYYSSNGSDWYTRLTLHGESAGYSDMIELDSDRIGVFAEVADGRSDQYTLKFFTVDKTDVLPGQGKAEYYDGSMVCNGKGYARIPANPAFNIPANGTMTVTCRALLNGERVNQDKRTLDFGIISSRGYPEHTVRTILKDKYAGFSGFGFIAGHDVVAGQTLGTNVTYDGQNNSKKTCLANAYSDALKISEWSHVAAVFDFSDNDYQVRVYVNGEEIERQTGAKGKAMSAPIGILLGSRFDVNFDTNDHESYYDFPYVYYRWYETPVVADAIFDSNIDDVRFYSEAFSAEDIKADMAGRFPIREKDSGLIAAYDFANINSTGEFEDISGNGHGAQTFVTDNYAFPAIEKNLPLHQVCDETKGILIVERFTGGHAVAVGQDYMASKNEDFRVSAVPADGYELACILVNGHPVDNNTFIKTAVATEVEARFRRTGAANIYIVGDVLSGSVINPVNKLEYTGNGNEYQISLPELKGHFWFEVTDEPVTRSASTPIVLDAHTDHYNEQNIGVAQDDTFRRHQLKNNLMPENPYAPLGNPEKRFRNVRMSLFYNPLENTKYFTFSGLITGIEDIETESEADVEAEYYTVQGIRVPVAAITPGIYIVRRGNRVSKIAIR